MEQVYIVSQDGDSSLEIRAKRTLTIQLHDSGVLTNNLLLVAHDGIPSWLAEIEGFTIPVGAFPKKAIISLGKTVSLQGMWNRTSAHMPREDLMPGRSQLLNAQELFKIGNPIGPLDEPFLEQPFGSGLTAAEARARLAWKYGVSEDRVKISIDF